MTALLLLLLAAAPLPAPVKNQPPAKTKSRWMTEGEAALSREVSAVASRPLAERLMAISQGFLDTPYVNSPLGEGEGTAPDPDPLFRLDAVDCLTFVEETIALAVTKGELPLLPVLERIRYGDKKSYAHRNHLMEAQWLPRNVEKGFVADVTERYGEADSVTAQKVLTAKTWSSKSSLALELPKAQQVTGTFTFKLVPLDKALAAAKRVPAGTLMMVVREDLPLKVTRITHLGFVHHKRGRPQLRHAARNMFGRVIDEDLESFLLRNSKYGKWKVSGVSFYEVREPSLTTPNVAKREP